MDGEFSLDVNVSPSEDTVWLNREQISKLFERDVKTIGNHISNIIKENELEKSVIAFFATTANDGKTYNVEYYNLDMVISIIKNDIIHDRFIIIDEVVYMIGTSINEIGKKRFVIIKSNYLTKDKILK